MKYIIFLACILILFDANAQEDLSYKGVALGDSKATFMQRLPHYDCSGLGCSFNLDRCYGSSVGIMNDEVYESYKKKGRECIEGTSFGGTTVEHGYASFIDGKLSKLTLTTQTSNMEMLSAVLEEKFGQPASVDRTPVKTRAGTTFQNWVKTWNSQKGVMLVSLHGSSIDEGIIVLMSHEAEQKENESRKKSIDTRKKDF